MELRLPRPLSHSSLSMYAQCPQKYKFKYIDKVPEKPKHYFSFGRSVHAALEYFYGVKSLPAPALEQLLGFYKENWVSAGYKDEAQEARYFDDGKTILSLFYRKHIQDYSIPYFVEYSFTTTVEGVPVTGKVDRIDKLPDGRIAILDYKTGKALAQDRAASDSQLTMYQMACEELLGAEVARLVFYHVPSLKEQTNKRHSGEQVAELKGRIVTTAESITKGLFDPRPEERKCFWCDYKPICPVFKGQLPPPTEAAPSQDELGALIDRYGDLQTQSAELREQGEGLKAEVLALLKKKGYVRAFGLRYEASRALSERWEFSDKKKVLEILKKAGLYDKVLAPSAPKIEQLLADPSLDGDLKARLGELGVKVETPDLKIKPL